jgi:hypothetical protein
MKILGFFSFPLEKNFNEGPLKIYAAAKLKVIRFRCMKYEYKMKASLASGFGSRRARADCYGYI